MAITLPADGCVLNFFGLGDPGPTHCELYSLAHNNEPKSHLQSPDAKQIIFWPKTLQKALHTDALVAICSSLRDLGTKRAVSLRISKRSCKIVKTLPCEMPNPALFLPPEFAYQSIPDPELSYIFLRRWHPVGVQTWLHLLKTFYRVWIPLPRI